jgi:hypothetical protein
MNDPLRYTSVEIGFRYWGIVRSVGNLILPVFAVRVKLQPSPMSYHNRSVPSLSTIEMSPVFDFTMPRKKLEFSFAASPVAKGDGGRGCGNEIAEGSGMGVRGKGQSPFLCWAVEKQRSR